MSVSGWRHGSALAALARIPTLADLARDVLFAESLLRVVEVVGAAADAKVPRLLRTAASSWDDVIELEPGRRGAPISFRIGEGAALALPLEDRTARRPGDVIGVAVVLTAERLHAREELRIGEIGELHGERSTPRISLLLGAAWEGDRCGNISGPRVLAETRWRRDVGATVPSLDDAGAIERCRGRYRVKQNQRDDT
ncbi:MAG TPA: hypothetical protein VF765_05170 [Polyangiaceae bacterium]